MKQLVQISPAYDKRNSDPDKNYGVHGCDLRFVLKGELGAVQFVIFTNWQLPHVTKEYKQKIYEHPDYADIYFLPMAADVGYHSPIPQYTGQESTFNSCEYLDDKPCYYDGSGLHAESLFEKMLFDGDKAIWSELESYYKSTFGELK